MTTTPSSGPDTRERGASLVELALLTPFLVLLLLGVIEFAWLFSQHIDVRTAAREGARLAVVNYPEGPSTSTVRLESNTLLLVAAVCDRMDDATDATVSIEALPNGEQGEDVTVVVSRPARTLTDALAWLIPDDLELSSYAEGRILYQATWANTTATTEACP